MNKYDPFLEFISGIFVLILVCLGLGYLLIVGFGG